MASCKATFLSLCNCNPFLFFIEISNNRPLSLATHFCRLCYLYHFFLFDLINMHKTYDTGSYASCTTIKRSIADGYNGPHFSKFISCGTDNLRSHFFVIDKTNKNKITATLLSISRSSYKLFIFSECLCFHN